MLGKNRHAEIFHNPAFLVSKHRRAGGGRVVRRAHSQIPSVGFSHAVTLDSRRWPTRVCLAICSLTITRIYFPKELSRLAGYVNEQQQEKKQSKQWKLVQQ